MKRFGICLTALLLLGSKMPVQAEEYTGGDWKVAFTGEGMESNFSSADISDAVYALQPGDSVTIRLELENKSSQATDWYMTNQVLSSLEDSSDTARGGAYAYELSYTDAEGGSNTLYSSESVGGEKETPSGLGLHEATDGLDEYFRLDTLNPGEEGAVMLTVSLDGETQGNAYQNTLADLRMNFAVESLNLTGEGGSGGGSGTEDGGQGAPGNGNLSYSTGNVRTGDRSNLILWSGIAFVSGILLLFLAILGFKKNKKEKGLPAAVLFFLAFLLLGTESKAASGYGYKITFYPGNHGTFATAGQVTVDNHQSGSDYRIENDGSRIVVSGLQTGDVVSFDGAMEGAVDLGENSRYYVKGIRQSGRDNSTVDTSAFRVESDRDYVVAYGIRGDMTSYTVNYQDASGNTLAPSRTYYGNVGDKPVIAFLYIEGYQPQAYNLTKTLSANAAENVFTFVYTALPAQADQETPGTDDGGQTGTGTEGGGGQAGTGTGGGGQTGAGTGSAAQTPGGAEQPPAGNQPGDNPDQDGGNPGDAGQGEGQEPGGGEQEEPDLNGEDVDLSEDNQAEAGPQDTIDLDEGEVPLAGSGPEGESGGIFRQYAAVWAVLALAVLAAAVAGIWYGRRRMKKVKTDRDGE